MNFYGGTISLYSLVESQIRELNEKFDEEVVSRYKKRFGESPFLTTEDGFEIKNILNDRAIDRLSRCELKYPSTEIKNKIVDGQPIYFIDANSKDVKIIDENGVEW